MADAALLLYDEAGNLIVDSKNVNMFLRHQGVGNSFTFEALDPVVFFRPTQQFSSMRALIPNGNGTYTVTFDGAAVEYYIFDRPWVTGGPIDIWSEDGRHIFMSTAKPMNVYRTMQMGRYWNPDGSGRGAYDGVEYGGLPFAKWAYCPSFYRQGYNCTRGPAGMTSTLLGEHFAARNTGVFSKFGQNLGFFYGWAPLTVSAFYTKSSTNDMAYLDVTGWL